MTLKRTIVLIGYAILLVAGAAASLAAKPDVVDRSRLDRLIVIHQEIVDLNALQLQDLDEAQKELAGAITSAAIIRQQAAALKASDDKHTADYNTEHDKNVPLQKFSDEMHSHMGATAIWFGLKIMAAWIIGSLLAISLVLGALSLFGGPVIGGFINMVFANLFKLFTPRN